MRVKSYIVVSGVVFALVAAGHLARLVGRWQVVVDGWTAPMWPSWGGMIAGGILSLWAFSLLRPKSE